MKAMRPGTNKFGVVEQVRFHNKVDNLLGDMQNEAEEYGEEAVKDLEWQVALLLKELKRQLREFKKR